MCRTDGSFSFNGSFSGNAMGDFLLGRPVQFYQENPAPDHTRQLHFAWYAQDDMRVSKRLTINAGMRYELPLQTVALNYAVSQYKLGAQSIIYPTASPGLLFWGDPGVTRSGTTTPTKAFAPRVETSYELTSDHKTVLRAGYGIYFNPNWANEANQFAIYQPFTRRITLNAPPSFSNPWANYPGGNPFPALPSLGEVGYHPGLKVVFDPDIGEFAYGPDFKELTMQQWNINIQRELAHNWLVTVGYAGSRTTHVPYLQDMNVPVYIPGQSTVANVDNRRPLYPYYSRYLLLETVTNANYNPLLVSVDKRFSRNFSLQLAYTFSKALGDEDAVLTNSGGATDPFNRHIDYGSTAFDVTHAFVFSWIWNVPSGNLGKGAKGLLFSNWQVNGFWTMYSGTPAQITSSVDRALYGMPNRPGRIGNPVLDPSRPRQQLVTKYFNTAAYIANQPGQFGNAPRADSQLRNPGSITVNLGVFRSFRGFTENQKLQFRSEFFNIFNRPNFGAPNSNLDGACFGCLTSAADGRLIQFRSQVYLLSTSMQRASRREFCGLLAAAPAIVAALKYMSGLVPNYCAGDIRSALGRYFGLVSRYYNERRADLFKRHPHIVLAAVGTVGLLQALAPDLVSGRSRWTDIFSDRFFYKTRAVEVDTYCKLEVIHETS